MNNSYKRKLVLKRHGRWIIANQTNTDIAGFSGEILKQASYHTFFKQSLNVELCKVSKREEKEEVSSYKTNSKI